MARSTKKKADATADAENKLRTRFAGMNVAEREKESKKAIKEIAKIRKRINERDEKNEAQEKHLKDLHRRMGVTQKADGEYDITLFKPRLEAVALGHSSTVHAEVKFVAAVVRAYQEECQAVVTKPAYHKALMTTISKLRTWLDKVPHPKVNGKEHESGLLTALRNHMASVEKEADQLLADVTKKAPSESIETENAVKQLPLAQEKSDKRNPSKKVVTSESPSEEAVEPKTTPAEKVKKSSKASVPTPAKKALDSAEQKYDQTTTWSKKHSLPDDATPPDAKRAKVTTSTLLATTKEHTQKTTGGTHASPSSIDKGAKFSFVEAMDHEFVQARANDTFTNNVATSSNPTKTVSPVSPASSVTVGRDDD